MTLIECIPNFSEGRRLEVVAQIVAAIKAVPGVHVLDVSSDPDHNRSVVTFVGSPEPVAEAAFRVVAQAAELINLDEHTGQHPRLGATDVLPFVPLRGATLAQCVDLARRVGQRIGDELHIPVYLYEAAATRPERVNLADVRRGQYEGLKVDITTPMRRPDFGPSRLGPAGATTVGARLPLIAYNVYLNTSDVDVAKRIARAVRHSNGGLRYVKALGLAVGGRAQVSMNLTDYTQTALHRAFALVQSEAARYGVTLVESEVVGLIPEDALFEAAEASLRLNHFRRDQILERRLAEIPDVSLAPVVDAVAAPTPTPGGGSVTALVAALAAGLAGMVAGLTVGRDRFAAVEDEMQGVLRVAATLRADLLRLVDDDAAAYQRVLTAYRLPRRTTEEIAARAAAIQAALVGAAETPLAVAEKSLATLRLLAQVARAGNPNAQTDARVGIVLAEAAIRGAALNIETNVRGFTDAAQADHFRQAIARIQEDMKIEDRG